MKPRKSLACIGAVTFFCSLISLHAYEIKVGVADQIYLKGDRVVDCREDIISELLADIEKYDFQNLVMFSRIESENAVDTVISAMKLCKKTKCDYLLYGFVCENPDDISAEIKLFNYQSKKVEKIFYARDDSEHLLRMERIIAEHVSEYFCSQLEINLEEKKSESRFEVWLPISVGGWVNLNETWKDHVTGCVALNVSCDFKPGFTISAKNCVMDFIVRGELGAKYGACNPNFYPGHYGSFQISLPAIFQINFARINNFLVGFGPLYEFEFMYASRLYENPSFNYANVICPQYLVEYQLLLGEKYRLSFGVEGVIPVGSKNPAWMSFNLGFGIRLNK